MGGAFLGSTQRPSGFRQLGRRTSAGVLLEPALKRWAGRSPHSLGLPVASFTRGAPRDLNTTAVPDQSQAAGAAKAARSANSMFVERSPRRRTSVVASGARPWRARGP